MRTAYLIPSSLVIKPCWKWVTAIGTHALTAKQLPSIQMRKVTSSAAHAPLSCHDSGHGFVWFRYEPRRDPTPFTRTCASRMAHRLRQTSIIFRQVEILLAHRRSKWTNSEAGNSNISTYYAFNVHLLTKSWQPYACLNSQNYHPPHGTPSFMAFPTYKLGCDRRYIPMVSLINSTSCQSTLSSTSTWHTADRIDFLFSGHLLLLLVSSAQLPALSQMSWFSAQTPRLAQKQQHKQQQQQQ